MVRMRTIRARHVGPDLQVAKPGDLIEVEGQSLDVASWLGRGRYSAMAARAACKGFVGRLAAFL